MASHNAVVVGCYLVGSSLQQEREHGQQATKHTLHLRPGLSIDTARGVAAPQGVTATVSMLAQHVRSSAQPRQQRAAA